MKVAWKVLLSLGGLMVLYAIFMDTTVSRGGERFHNIGLQQQQLMLLILGCVMFLAGIGLFGVAKLKQKKEEEEEEARAARERVQKAAESAEAIDREVRHGLESVRTGGLNLWHMVRRPYVLALGLLVVVLTILFPSYLVTDYINGGIKTDIPTTMLLGTGTPDAPLMVNKLIFDLSWRMGLCAFLYWKAMR